MPRKLFLFLFVLLLSLTGSAANKKTQITMLVVPRQPLLVQIAQDISRRYTALLVCYQQQGDRTAIHAWNGKSWVAVSEEAYARGEFFKAGPSHAVIVENGKGSAPKIMTPDGTWCKSGNRISTTDPRAVIHLLGRYFDFPYSYWMQFSQRYNYDLEAVNPSLLNVYWWHFRGKDLLPAMEKRDYRADMGQWLYLDGFPVSPVMPAAPVAIQKAPKTAAAPKPVATKPKPVEAEPKSAVPELLEDMFEPEQPEPPAKSPAKIKKAADVIQEPEAEIIHEQPAEKPAAEKEYVVKPAKIIMVPAAPADLDPAILKLPTGSVNPFSAREIPKAELIPSEK